MHIVQVKNQRSGITYVYESQGYWDTEKQQARNRRKCIGKLDPEIGALIPSRKYQIEQELTALQKRTPEPVPSKACTRLFWGATYCHVICEVS